MKRLRVILLFLLLGAIVNVAVAWGIAWWSSAILARHPSQPFKYGYTPGGEQYGEWATYRYASFGFECIHSNWRSPDIPNGLNPFPSAYSAASILPWWATYAHANVTPIIEARRFLVATGWPMLTFWTGRESLGLLKQDYPAGTPDEEMTTGIPAPTFYLGILIPNQPVTSILTLHNLRVLPYGLLWPGLVFNTIFYAGLLWLLIPGPFVLRRLIRHKRGICVKCAYDLRGVEHEACPECGEGIRRANPA